MGSYYAYSYALEDWIGAIFGLLSVFPVIALNIASYVLMALALYTIAKRRQIRKPWLAWIPILDCWVVGSISDQYRYVVKGEIKSKRKILLTLQVLKAVLIVAIFACALVAVVMTVISDAYYTADTAGLVLAVCGLGLALVGSSIAYLVVYFMALYDVYRSLDPENGVLFLVLSILIPVTKPFFLFFCRNKDKGMPPRRDQSPVQEPWETENKDYL